MRFAGESLKGGAPKDFDYASPDGGSRQRNVDVRLHLDSPESATMTMDAVSTADGRTAKMSHKAVSRWIGSDCGKLAKGSIPH